MLCLAAKICLFVVLQLHPSYIPVSLEHVARVADPTLPGHVLVAHSNMVGGWFYSVEVGEEITYRDEKYTVERYGVYQAVEPENVLGDLIELESGKRLTVEEAHQQIYYYDGLVLQTCFTREGDRAWGRFFVFAKKNK